VKGQGWEYGGIGGDCSTGGELVGRSDHGLSGLHKWHTITKTNKQTNNWQIATYIRRSYAYDTTYLNVQYMIVQYLVESTVHRTVHR